MSFTQEVKEEIIRNSPDSEYQIKYELEVFFRHTISFTDEDTILFKTENKIVALRFFDNIERIYNISLHSLFDFDENSKYNYECEITNKDIFIDALNANSTSFSLDAMSSEHKRIYIATTFLITGCVLNPEKTYHIEFAISNLVHARYLKELLLEYAINLKELKRKNTLILYIKDSEQISKFLSIVNAFNAVLNMENIKIVKDVRNSINRNVNCETANLQKTISASLKQVEAIEKISKLSGLESLDESLLIVARARLENKESNLQELADMLEISKSCINHRFRKIIEIADSL